MKKFALLCLLAFIPMYMAFADGNVTCLDNKSITITSLQSGNIQISFPATTVILTPDQRSNFIDILKSHADFLNTVTTEKISIKNHRYTGELTISTVDKFEFWLYLNEVKDNPYVFEIMFNTKDKDFIDFTYDSLSSFIKELENTKSITDDYSKQSSRIDDLVKTVRAVVKK